MSIRSDRVEKISVCPYCYEPQGDKHVCCGENHFEEGYLTDDGEIYLKTDVKLVEPTIAEIEEDLMNRRADDAYDAWAEAQMEDRW